MEEDKKKTEEIKTPPESNGEKKVFFIEFDEILRGEKQCKKSQNFLIPIGISCQFFPFRLKILNFKLENVNEKQQKTLKKQFLDSSVVFRHFWFQLFKLKETLTLEL